MKTIAKHSLRFILVMLCVLIQFINCIAEGSRELNAITGPNARRIYLSQGLGQVGGVTNWYKITTLDSIEARNNFYVYANAGDSICMASSASGIGFGGFVLIRPDGTTAVVHNSNVGGIGYIAPNAGSRARELNGPFGLHNSGFGGYTPVVFVADQTGIYIVGFSSPNPTSGASNVGPPHYLTSQDFPQPINNTVISAFDVSIVKNGSIQNGRVYANYLVLTSGHSSSMQYTDLNVLTREGYRYLLSFRALQPYGYFIYTDNVGLQLPDAVTPAYESNTYNPRPSNRRIMVPDIDPETPFETKHKIFFNNPDPIMPANATLNNSSVWLNPVLNTSTYYVSVTYSNTGVPNAMAGTLNFNIPNFGVRYKMQIDINNNSVFGEPGDVTINGATNVGLNTVNWDGTDGTGSPVAVGCFNVKLDFIAGELHVPLADAENFRGGIRIRRLNGNGVLPNDTIHWNDLPLNDFNETPAGSYIKRTPYAGVNSNFTLPIDTSIRRWEPSTGAIFRGTHILGTSYGNDRFMDQWAFDTLSTNIFTPLACLVVLPESLGSFNVLLKSKKEVNISWSFPNLLTSPTHFLVERSNNGQHFSVIKEVHGSVGSKSFETSDLVDFSGDIFYRLKWKNESGEIKYSAIKKIVVQEAFLFNRVYPNPTSDFLNIEMKSNSKTFTVKLNDLMGRTYLNIQVLKNSKIDIRSFPAGTYFLTVTDNQGNIQTDRIQISGR